MTQKLRKTTTGIVVIALLLVSLCAIFSHANINTSQQDMADDATAAVSDADQNDEDAAVDSSHVIDEAVASDGNDAISHSDGHPAFSPSEEFLHYTEEPHRVTLPGTYGAEETANVVGVVLDQDSKQPVSGATISADGTALVCTGDDGRFQITNMPNGTYNWRITAENYYDSQYLNYSVHWADITDIFTFYVSDSAPIERDRNEIVKPASPASVTSNHQARPPAESSIAPTALYETPLAYSTVSVKGYGTRINRQEYIYTVLSSELFVPDWYLNASGSRSKVLTSAQLEHLYVAQAMAINTYVEYAQHVYSNHSGYDVCGNSNCCHNYDPNRVTEFAINCSTRLFNSDGTTQLYFHLLPGSGFEYFCSRFFSACQGNGSVTDPNQPQILVATPCTDFDVGYSSVRKGLCQMGAAELARKNYPSGSIMTYYFTDVIPMRCRLTAR